MPDLPDTLSEIRFACSELRAAQASGRWALVAEAECRLRRLIVKPEKIPAVKVEDGGGDEQE